MLAADADARRRLAADAGARRHVRAAGASRRQRVQRLRRYVRDSGGEGCVGTRPAQPSAWRGDVAARGSLSAGPIRPQQGARAGPVELRVRPIRVLRLARCIWGGGRGLGSFHAFDGKRRLLGHRQRQRGRGPRDGGRENHRHAEELTQGTNARHAGPDFGPLGLRGGVRLRVRANRVHRWHEPWLCPRQRHLAARRRARLGGPRRLPRLGAPQRRGVQRQLVGSPPGPHGARREVPELPGDAPGYPRRAEAGTVQLRLARPVPRAHEGHQSAQGSQQED
mmetsp:Transcript_84814/g.258948  ORF Transcript_84814/g.258948 Transcript_84814/m.258948 type:complete len:280 (-) Transcript_84814:211-1050(-)